MEIYIRIGRFRTLTYGDLEYDADTNLTDEDMLKMHIDFALENGDEAKFLELSERLREMSE